MFKKEFKLYKLVKVDNGVGGYESKPKLKKAFKGYLDMLSGDDTLAFNSNIQESTHVLLTKELTEVSANDWIVDWQGNKYDITYPDNPVGRDHHLEIYLKQNATRKEV